MYLVTYPTALCIIALQGVPSFLLKHMSERGKEETFGGVQNLPELLVKYLSIRVSSSLGGIFNLESYRLLNYVLSQSVLPESLYALIVFFM